MPRFDQNGPVAEPTSVPPICTLEQTALPKSPWLRFRPLAVFGDQIQDEAACCLARLRSPVSLMRLSQEAPARPKRRGGYGRGSARWLTVRHVAYPAAFPDRRLFPLLSPPGVTLHKMHCTLEACRAGAAASRAGHLPTKVGTACTGSPLPPLEQLLARPMIQAAPLLLLSTLGCGSCPALQLQASRVGTVWRRAAHRPPAGLPRGARQEDPGRDPHSLLNRGADGLGPPEEEAGRHAWGGRVLQGRTSPCWLPLRCDLAWLQAHAIAGLGNARRFIAQWGNTQTASPSRGRGECGLSLRCTLRGELGGPQAPRTALPTLHPAARPRAGNPSWSSPPSGAPVRQPTAAVEAEAGGARRAIPTPCSTWMSTRWRATLATLAGEMGEWAWVWVVGWVGWGGGRGAGGAAAHACRCTWAAAGETELREVLGELPLAAHPAHAWQMPTWQ